MKLERAQRYIITKEGATLSRMVKNGMYSWEKEIEKLKVGDIITFFGFKHIAGEGPTMVAAFAKDNVSGKFNPSILGSPILSFLEKI